MKNQFFEQALRGEVKTVNGEGSLARAYRDARAHNISAPIIDTGTCIWEKDVPDMIAAAKRHGVKRFYIASGYSGLLDVLWAFQQGGCKIGKIENLLWTAESSFESERRVSAIAITVGGAI
jgi:hypothetical protein